MGGVAAAAVERAAAATPPRRPERSPTGARAPAARVLREQLDARARPLRALGPLPFERRREVVDAVRERAVVLREPPRVPRPLVAVAEPRLRARRPRRGRPRPRARAAPQARVALIRARLGRALGLARPAHVLLERLRPGAARRALALRRGERVLQSRGLGLAPLAVPLSATRAASASRRRRSCAASSSRCCSATERDAAEPLVDLAAPPQRLGRLGPQRRGLAAPRAPLRTQQGLRVRASIQGPPELLAERLEPRLEAPPRTAVLAVPVVALGRRLLEGLAPRGPGLLARREGPPLLVALRAAPRASGT